MLQATKLIIQSEQILCEFFYSKLGDYAVSVSPSDVVNRSSLICFALKVLKNALKGCLAPVLMSCQTKRLDTLPICFPQGKLNIDWQRRIINHYLSRKVHLPKALELDLRSFNDNALDRGNKFTMN